MKTRLLSAAAVLSLSVLAACSSDADMASINLSKAAEDFKIVRKISFYDSIQGEVVLQVVGRCSVETEAIGTTVVCKDQGEYMKHFLGHADNMTFFAEQLQGADVSTARYKVFFRPSALIPDIDLEK